MFHACMTLSKLLLLYQKSSLQIGTLFLLSSLLKINFKGEDYSNNLPSHSRTNCLYYNSRIVNSFLLITLVIYKDLSLLEWNFLKIGILPNLLQMHGTKNPVFYRDSLIKHLLKWWMDSKPRLKLFSHIQYFSV